MPRAGEWVHIFDDERLRTQVLEVAHRNNGVVDGDDFPAGDAYYSGRMTLPSGATVEGQGLNPETTAAKLVEAAEARLA
jgi:hypothetical protein